jgi:hypothetical protein
LLDREQFKATAYKLVKSDMSVRGLTRVWSWRPLEAQGKMEMQKAVSGFKSKSGLGTAYRIVGEWYAHRLMDDEAMNFGWEASSIHQVWL